MKAPDRVCLPSTYLDSLQQSLVTVPHSLNEYEKRTQVKMAGRHRERPHGYSQKEGRSELFAR